VKISIRLYNLQKHLRLPINGPNMPMEMIRYRSLIGIYEPLVHSIEVIPDLLTDGESL